LWTSCKADKLCSLCTKVNELAHAGLRIVVAVGNQGPGPDTLTCPAMAYCAFSVSASETDYLPPGRMGRFLKRNLTGFYYYMGKGWTGTSVSAALVSGGVALLVSAFPDLRVAEIKDATKLTATRLGDEDGPREAHWYRAYKLIDHRRAGRTFDPDLGYKHYQAGLERGRLGDYAASIVELEAAVALAPTSATFYDDLGVAQLRVGDVERALVTFRESLRLHWKLVAAHYHFAWVLERQRRWRDAERHYAVALQFDPNNQGIKSNLERVQQLLRFEAAGAIVV